MISIKGRNPADTPAESHPSIEGPALRKQSRWRVRMIRIPRTGTMFRLRNRTGLQNFASSFGVASCFISRGYWNAAKMNVIGITPNTLKLTQVSVDCVRPSKRRSYFCAVLPDPRTTLS